jgi:hypothetical protein
VVRMVVDTVVETVEVDDVTAPFVLVFIQSWKAATRVYRPESVARAHPMPLLVRPISTHWLLDANIINGPPESPWHVSIKRTQNNDK